MILKFRVARCCHHWMNYTYSSYLVTVVSNSVILMFRVGKGSHHHHWLDHNLSSFLVMVVSNSVILRLKVGTCCHHWLGHSYSPFLV